MLLERIKATPVDNIFESMLAGRLKSVALNHRLPPFTGLCRDKSRLYSDLSHLLPHPHAERSAGDCTLRDRSG
jgi:hypothetical protein